PVLGTLPPSFSPLGRQRLGEAIGRGAATAAQTPGSRVIIRVDQPIAARRLSGSAAGGGSAAGRPLDGSGGEVKVPVRHGNTRSEDA
ncbi:hypothetical protein, partial [Nocardia farcinica]|uniref:hypothetical protein n=1 Tax=Nocardia farcinica TaxID=37329 RepID=UPI0024585DA7